MSKFFARFRRDSRGIAAIEVAFIMPFLLFLYFGLVDLTAMISLNRKVTYAASVVADLVTQNDSTVNSSDIDDYFNAAELVMKPTPIDNVRVEVYQYRSVSGTITNQWSRKSPDGGDCAPPRYEWHGQPHDGRKRLNRRRCLHDLLSLYCDVSWRVSSGRHHLQYERTDRSSPSPV